MTIIHEMQQGTPEWHEIRKGKMTASHAQEIGNNGKGLETYVYEILAGEFSSGEVDFYTNKHMERGIELEESARSIFGLENDCIVKQVGFIEYNEYVGCSPDGLIGEDGGIEIKCHEDVRHFKMIIGGAKEIESKYIWQIQMNLLITGRKWWKYVAYNPNFEKSLLIFEILPDKEMHEKLLAGFAIGEAKMKDIKSQIQ